MDYQLFVTYVDYDAQSTRIDDRVYRFLGNYPQVEELAFFGTSEVGLTFSSYPYIDEIKL